MFRPGGGAVRLLTGGFSACGSKTPPVLTFTGVLYVMIREVWSPPGGEYCSSL